MCEARWGDVVDLWCALCDATGVLCDSLVHATHSLFLLVCMHVEAKVLGV
jgi:hypothetical protein